MPQYNALADRPSNMLAYPDAVRATPRNEYLGALADLIAQSYSPQRTQQMQGTAKFLSMPAISETLDRLSYGEPLTTGAGGLGGTTRVRPEVLEAGMAVAPMAEPVTMATLQAARAARQAALRAGMAGERYAERVVPGIMERGGMPAQMLQDLAQGTRRNIFIGENSKTWNAGNAAKAVELEKAGVAPEEIWAATGTFRGAEGKLRQEISDKGSRLTEKVHQDIMSKGYFNDPISGALTHEQLFQAYPELANINATLRATELPGGSFNKFSSEIEASGPSTMHQKSTMLHELQHAIQQREGFAGGSSPSGPYPEGVREQILKDQYEQLKALTKYDPSNPYSSPNSLTEEELLKMAKRNTDSLNGVGRMQAYRRSAGEVEARAVQKRRNLTDEERKKEFPFRSFDVPINQLIINK
jgi:hypothetical protein